MSKGGSQRAHGTSKSGAPPKIKDISKLKLKDLRPDISPRGPQYLLMKEVGKLYGLRTKPGGDLEGSDRESFNAAWRVSKVWRELTRSFDLDEKGHAVQRYVGKSLTGPVTQAFDHLKRMVGQGTAIDQEGYRVVSAQPWSGKYVVFSDHHRSIDSERQNFFAKNNKLYVDALKKYADNDFTVIENGDVEELFVRRYSKAEYRDWLDMTFGQLQKRRIALRLQVLKNILAAPENAALYATLGELSQNGRLLRVVGNHDPELKRPEFLEALRKKLPNLPLPADFVFLGQGANHRTPVKMVISHGHHFDEFTNPENAPFLGELISETMSWAYQGADRNWTWHKDGGNVGKWLDGSTAFNNQLVSSDHAGFNPFEFFHDKSAEEALEGLLGKNVAWEYFVNKNPLDAFHREVMKGKAFFKFRHMNEVDIMNGWNRVFPQAASRPQLLLGHSHEVRFQPRIPGTTKRYDHLLNSGAAGRFENLIWGVEVNNGKAQVVAWSHKQRTTQKDARRYVYSVNEQGLIPEEKAL